MPAQTPPDERLWLPGAGFSELIPTLVLSNPSFATWDDVQRVAEEFGSNIDGVLNSDLFSKVRHLDGLRFAQADEKRKLAGASKQLGTELRDIRHKIEVVRSMRPHPHYSQHFRLPAARWDEYDALLATAEPNLYPLVEAAYTAAHRVNEHLGFRRTRTGDPTKTLGVIKDDGLDAAYEAAGEALDALEEPRGEVWESGVDRDIRTVTEDVVREGVQRGLDSESDET